MKLFGISNPAIIGKDGISREENLELIGISFA